MRNEGFSSLGWGRGLALACIVALGLGTIVGSGGGGVDEPGPVARLEVSPSAVLLNAVGQTQTLKVQAFDANGVEIPNAPISFASSHPDQISVTNDGIVRAAVPVGSAVVSVSSGAVTAAPLLAAAAETYPSTILVSDAQVLTGPQPLARTVNGIGGRYTVVVKGIAPPAAGTVMLASGTYPIAGKVVSSITNGGDALVVTLELVPLNQLFRNLSVSGTMSPQEVARLAKPVANATQRRFAITARVGPLASNDITAGPFTCVPSFDTSLLKVELTPTLTQSLGFTFDFGVNDGVDKAFMIVFSGSIEGSVSGTITAGAVKGSLDCTATLLTIPIPLGPFAGFVGPSAPLGLALRSDIDASTNFSVGVSFSLGADATFGLKFDSAGQYIDINKITLRGPTPPDISPTFPNTSARVTFTEFGGVTAALTVSTPLGDLPNALEVRAGGTCQ